MSKKIVSTFAVAAMLFTAGSAFSAVTLTQIGRSPFVRPPLASMDDLHHMVTNQADDVRRGFEKAGRPELYQPFMEQIKTANITQVDMPLGTHFDWMFYKKNGSGAVRLSRDVTWGNETPFPAYTFTVTQDNTNYLFAVPLGCGNIALVGEEMVEAEVAPANVPPVCKATINPHKAAWGSDIVVDASGSSDPDGSITGMTIIALDAEGLPIARQDVEGSLVGSIALPVGATAIQASVIDNSGASASSEECIVPVKGTKPLNMIVDVGGMHMFDPGTWVFGRAGVEYRFTDNWSVLGMLGYAQHIAGSDGESAVLVDVIGEYRVDRLFFDMGAGGWISTSGHNTDYDDSQIDLILAAGYIIAGDPEASNTSFFFEARNAFDELGSPRDCGRYGVGVRFKF